MLPKTSNSSRKHLGKWLAEQSLGKPPAVYEIELREQMDKRFEAVDRRFEMLTQRMDSFMLWLYAITLTVGGLITVAALKLLP